MVTKMPDEILHVVTLVAPHGLGVGPPAPGAGQQLAGRLMLGSQGLWRLCPTLRRDHPDARHLPLLRRGSRP